MIFAVKYIVVHCRMILIDSDGNFLGDSVYTVCVCCVLICIIYGFDEHNDYNLVSR